MFRVKYKTPHNIFFRRIFRVISARLEGGSWTFYLSRKRRVIVPVEGTIFVFGTDHHIEN